MFLIAVLWMCQYNTCKKDGEHSKELPIRFGVDLNKRVDPGNFLRLRLRCTLIGKVLGFFFFRRKKHPTDC